MDEVDKSVLEVNRLLGELAAPQALAGDRSNSTIVRSALNVERKHLVRGPDRSRRLSVR